MIPSNHFFIFRKSDSAVADSSTDPGKKDIATPSPAAATAVTNPLMTKNIINYANDSLSISSVVSGQPSPPQAQAIPISPKTSPQSASKISLVPTKLLLKPQAGNSFKSTPTIVYSSVQSSTSVAGTITTNAQSSIPMKVVFVNALNNNANAQGGQKPQQITINNKSLAQLQHSQNSAFLANKLLTTAHGQKVQIVQSTNFHSVPKVTTTVNNNGAGGKSAKILLGGNKFPGEFKNVAEES